MPTRRELLLAGGALSVAGASLASLSGCARGTRDRDLYAPGRLLTGDAERGHRLRERYVPRPPEHRISCETIIVGAGISGLAAADALDSSGRHDYRVVDLADEAGGNSVAGRNSVGSYPWAAHYVPIADPEDLPLIRLFERFGIVRGFDGAGLPIYDEEALCSDPDERLWRQGMWQEGFVPTIGVPASARGQIARFLAETERWRTTAGNDGRPAFALPVSRSSGDAALEALDGLTFADYLRGNGYTAPELLWYLDYCCRDDYGAPATGVSAWAGLHYFAARRGRAANATHSDLVTWPEGNAHLARLLAEPAGQRLLTGHLVRRVTAEDGRVIVIADSDGGRGSRLEINAQAAILATPSRVLPYLSDSIQIPGPAATHVPWVVANVTLSRRPAGDGAPLAWDNVRYASPQLGYVVADHQSLARPKDSVVLTCYWPLSDGDPVERRRWALGRAHADWCADFVGELLWLHPDLRGHVLNVDVRVWGHGMVCPAPGYGTNVRRAARAAARPPLFFAHTDLAGLSVFEEAYAQGQRAGTERAAWRG